MRKGIVISPPFQILPTGGISCGNDPGPLDLRKYLLYWDVIDYPTNNFIHISSHDIDYLETTDSLKRTKVLFSGTINSGNGEFLIAAQEAALKENQKNEPGQWTIAQLSDTPFYTEKTQVLGVEIEMYNVLPVPSSDTPLADILEYKEIRKDELQAFQIYMDEIYQKILSSADIPRAKTTEIIRLQRAIKDIDTTLKENKIRRVSRDIKSIINADFSGILGAGLGAAGLSSMISLPPLLLGLSAAGIVVSYKYTTKPNSTKCPSGISYLNKVGRI